MLGLTRLRRLLGTVEALAIDEAANGLLAHAGPCGNATARIKPISRSLIVAMHGSALPMADLVHDVNMAAIG